MDADTIFKLLAEAYKQVKEKADTYGDDGHSIQAINILPSVPKPGKKGKVNEIALKEPESKYIIMYYYGPIIKERGVQELLMASGVDSMLLDIPVVEVEFDIGFKVCAKLALQAVDKLVSHYGKIFTLSSNPYGNGYMVYMNEQLLFHIFLRVVGHRLG